MHIIFPQFVVDVATALTIREESLPLSIAHVDAIRVGWVIDQFTRPGPVPNTHQFANLLHTNLPPSKNAFHGRLANVGAL